MKSLKSDVIAGLVWLAIGLYVIIDANSYVGVKALDPIGPAYLPRILGVGISLLGIGLSLSSYLKLKKFDKAQDVPEELPESARGGSMRIVLTVLTALAYALLLKPVGFPLVTPFFVAGVMIIYGDKDKKRILAMSLGTTIVLYVVFAVGLGVLLPTGILAPLLNG